MTAVAVGLAFAAYFAWSWRRLNRMSSTPHVCKCCLDPHVVGYFGLCQPCTDAVNRFLRLRAVKLRGRKRV